MKSSKHSPPLELEKSLKTTAEDVDALRRAARPVAMSPEDYLRFLESFGDTPTEELRRRPGPRGEPFRLVAPESAKP